MAAQLVRVMIGLTLLVSLVFQALAAADLTQNENVTLESEDVAASRMNFTTSNFVSGRCATSSYKRGSDYRYSVDALFSKLIENIEEGLQIWEDASDAYDNMNTVYGIAGCSNLTAVHCEQCLKTIMENLVDWCPRHALTAEIIFKDCSLRYDNHYIKLPQGVQID